MRRKLALAFLGLLLLLTILSATSYFYARSHLQQWFSIAQLSLEKIGVSLKYQTIKPLNGLGLELNGVHLSGAKLKYALTTHTARFGLDPQLAWPPLRLTLSLRKPIIHEPASESVQGTDNNGAPTSAIPKSGGILLLLCQPTLEIESAKIIPLNIESINITARAGNYTLSSYGLASVDLQTKFSLKLERLQEALEGNAIVRYQPRTISIVQSAVDWNGNAFEINGDWTFKEPGWIAGFSGKSIRKNQGMATSGNFTLSAFSQGNNSPYEATLNLKEMNFTGPKGGLTASNVNGTAEVLHQPGGETSIRLVALTAELSSARILGKMKSNMDLHFSGGSSDEVLKSLAGKGSVQLREGELKLVKFASQPLETLSQIPGMSRWIRKTKWEEKPVTAKAEVLIGKQMVKIPHFQVLAPDFEAVGKDASVTFDSTLQANIDFFPKDSLVDLKGLEALKDESGRPSFPMRASGKIDSIVVSIDGAAVEQRLRAFVQKKVPDLGNKIQEGLKKIFGK